MSKKALLAVALPFLSNPVVLTVAAIGVVGLTVYELFSNKEEGQDNDRDTVTDGSEPLKKLLNNENSTALETVYPDWGAVGATVEETVNRTVRQPNKTARVTVDELLNPTVEEPHTPSLLGDATNEPQKDRSTDDEAAKKEMIRQAMSELGKRSAAARVRKKNR